MTVYFHGNFGLNREYMAGVLKSLLETPKKTAVEIAEPFGYKAPFTARYKSWLHKTGLITESKTAELTPLGEIVWGKDPKLESMVTQWHLHHELAGDPDRAEAWSYFAHEFLPANPEFSIGDLQSGLSMKLMSHHPSHFGRNAPMIKVIARKQIQCYTQSEGLGALGLIRQEGKDKYRAGKPKVIGPWSTPDALVRAYG